MTYSVKEAFYTLQGEGAHTGRAAVFLRFAGCNLWSGLERDREKAVCRFCDTDFVGTNGEGGGKFRQPHELAAHVKAIWAANAASGGRPYVVCTGGGPLVSGPDPSRPKAMTTGPAHAGTAQTGAETARRGRLPA